MISRYGSDGVSKGSVGATAARRKTVHGLFPIDSAAWNLPGFDSLEAACGSPFLAAPVSHAGCRAWATPPRPSLPRRRSCARLKC